MAPESTLNEIDRVLKANGVLLIYDVIWPPSVNYICEQAYNELFDKVHKLTQELKEPIAHKWDKGQHLDNVRKCNHFHYVKASYYHKSEKFDSEKFIGIALSQGGLEALLKRGYSEEATGITKFRETIASYKTIIHDIMTYNYQVIFGVRKE
jgi:hypothetical protein